MVYISARQFAKKRGLSERYAQKLLSGGRVPGAKRLGHAWLVPEDAEKPADPRRARRQPQASPPRYLACGLITNVVPMPKANPEAALSGLPDDDQRAQYAAELSYLRGDFDAVKAYYACVESDSAAYLCAANVAIIAAMSTGDYALFKVIEESAREIAENAPSEEDRRAASILPAFASVCMNAPAMAPVWLKSGDFSGFSPLSRPMLVLMRVKYLQSTRQWEAMLASAQTALEIYQRDGSYTQADIYLTGLSACACYALGRANEARRYLDIAVGVCAECGFVSPLGEYTAWVGGMLELALKRCAPSFESAVLAHIEATLRNWLSFHNEFAQSNATLVLSTREYQLALLLSEGKTYAQAARQLCLSEGRVKNMVSVIYGKLGISKKAELAKLVF